ncbi:hypothetical protein Har1130_00080 [Haloarcula sp. CBA1130]|nr:hypothetical protein Har1129_15200 [Haloarcula sp. CBA1129]KAA9401214.1 hypothetical protein Har1130_00080 [Haloarcula sp. CBA1130]
MSRDGRLPAAVRARAHRLGVEGLPVDRWNLVVAVIPLGDGLPERPDVETRFGQVSLYERWIDGDSAVDDRVLLFVGVRELEVVVADVAVGERLPHRLQRPADKRPDGVAVRFADVLEEEGNHGDEDVVAVVVDVDLVYLGEVRVLSEFLGQRVEGGVDGVVGGLALLAVVWCQVRESEAVEEVVHLFGQRVTVLRGHRSGVTAASA